MKSKLKQFSEWETWSDRYKKIIAKKQTGKTLERVCRTIKIKGKMPEDNKL